MEQKDSPFDKCANCSWDRRSHETYEAFGKQYNNARENTGCTEFILGQRFNYYKEIVAPLFRNSRFDFPKDDYETKS